MLAAAPAHWAACIPRRAARPAAFPPAHQVAAVQGQGQVLLGALHPALQLESLQRGVAHLSGQLRVLRAAAIVAGSAGLHGATCQGTAVCRF